MPIDTPMMKQYVAMKVQYPDSLLFFRLGDFYEMFDEDAKTAAKELDLMLTTRDRTAPKEQQVPMCGVPAHSVDGYIARLITKGYKVAICEQMEDPKLAKGLVEREVLRTVTPGTATMAGALDDARNNFIGAVALNRAKCAAGLAFCDFSTGEFYATSLSADSLDELGISVQNEISRYDPRELILRDDEELPRVKRWIERFRGALVTVSQADKDAAERACREKFGEGAGTIEKTPAPEAVGSLLHYIYLTQKSTAPHIRHLECYRSRSFMELDQTARRNLELTASMRTGEKHGSLLHVLDRTKTAMGARLLRSWLERPLVDVARITRRHEAVGELVTAAPLRDALTEELKSICDLERVMTRISAGTVGARELRALADSARHLAPVKEMLAGTESPLLRELSERIDPLDDIISDIEATLVDEPPLILREGGLIRDEFSPEVARLRRICQGGRGETLAIEERERERTGIRTLKIGYNKVFGYYIEVRRSGSEKVPEDYIRKQTLVDRERYITEELKNLESEILTASERISALEYELFCELRDRIALAAERVQETAHAVASADALASFAAAAQSENYCRPTVDMGDRLVIRDGRHPVVEKMLDGGLFVPNDLELDCGANTVAIITGPNMAGKSTYMRQAALIVIMAQAGSFVPAREAQIGIVDRVFTRIGASDDLASGRSTFMVEMSEVAEILKNATRRSLLILDEIGRGTSTFDGMAIARAVLEWVADRSRIGAKTMFATHYHELTVMEDELEGVKNYNIAVKKRGDSIIFLRKIVRGGADDSYGVEVAKLAGLPDELIARARKILGSLESGARDETRAVPARGEDDGQMSLGGVAASALSGELARIDPNALSPYEAWQKLAEFVSRAKETE